MFVEASRVRAFITEAVRYHEAVQRGVHPDETAWARAFHYVRPLLDEPVVIEGREIGR